MTETNTDGNTNSKPTKSRTTRQTRALNGLSAVVLVHIWVRSDLSSSKRLQTFASHIEPILCFYKLFGANDDAVSALWVWRETADESRESNVRFVTVYWRESVSIERFVCQLWFEKDKVLEKFGVFCTFFTAIFFKMLHGHTAPGNDHGRRRTSIRIFFSYNSENASKNQRLVALKSDKSR